MTTKKKCFTLAESHGIIIEYDLKTREQYYHVSLPEGYQMDSNDDRTGLTLYMGLGKQAKDLWFECYKDIEECIRWEKDWVKIPE
jgi:hypothetical protein